MDACFVYIIRCNDNTLYTGWTTDLDRRLGEHNLGTASKYTRVRLPVKLAYSEQVATRSDALKREYAIKNLSRLQKEELIKSKS